MHKAFQLQGSDIYFCLQSLFELEVSNQASLKGGNQSTWLAQSPSKIL